MEYNALYFAKHLHMRSGLGCCINGQKNSLPYRNKRMSADGSSLLEIICIHMQVFLVVLHYLPIVSGLHGWLAWLAAWLACMAFHLQLLRKPPRGSSEKPRDRAVNQTPSTPSCFPSSVVRIDRLRCRSSMILRDTYRVMTGPSSGAEAERKKKRSSSGRPSNTGIAIPHRLKEWAFDISLYVFQLDSYV